MNKVLEYEKLTRENQRYNNACQVLWEILQQHPEIKECVDCLLSYINDIADENEVKMKELYGKHGEGLIG